MKKLLLLLFSLLMIQGCNKDNSTEPTQTDPTGSKAKEQQAYTLMETEMVKAINGHYNNPAEFQQLKMTEVNSLFRSAIQLDPSNTNAQFGAAISEILSAFWDTTIYNVISEFESFGMNKPLSSFMGNAIIPAKSSQMIVPLQNSAEGFVSIYKTAMQNPPLISRVQKMLRENLLPRIDFAINCLAAVETNPAFRYKISGKMQGDASLDTISIYRTEVYMTDALLHGLRFMINSFLIFKYDLPDYSQASIVQALQQNSTTFLYISSDGRTRAATAKSDLSAIISKFRAGISDLENISGNKPDAIIRLGSDGMSQSDLANLKTRLNESSDWITNTKTVQINGSDGIDHSVNISLANMFTNIPDNPKAAFFPAYTLSIVNNEVKFQFNATTYEAFTFPDPTFGGLFPGMTNDVLKKILDINKLFK